MTVRFINTLILVLFVLLGLTGLYGLVWPFPAFLFEIHRATGLALVLLVPWKGLISIRSLRRGLDGRLGRNLLILVSALLSIATIAVLTLGLMWAWNIGGYYVWIGPYAFSAIGWHWGTALGLAPLFIIHAWRRWPRPKSTDFAGRRQALKLLGIGAATAVTWGAAEGLSRLLQSPNSPRRFTGSREAGSFTGLDYPVTSAADQGLIRLTPGTWSLGVHGAVRSMMIFSYAEALVNSNSETTATLDCTGGWYTVQVWRGIRLADLLEQAGVQADRFMIALRDVTGYTARLTPAEAAEVLLATHVGGKVLDHWHGYPMRAVVPSRRGWHWVKWLTEVEVVAA